MKTLLLTLLLTLAPLTLSAQEVVTAVLFNAPIAQRDAQTLITNSITREQVPNVEGQWVRVQLEMTQADVLRTELTWSLILEEFVPAGGGWRFVTGGPTQGGENLDPETGQQIFPRLLFHPSQFHPDATLIRFQISIPVRMRLGARVETLTGL